MLHEGKFLEGLNQLGMVHSGVLIKARLGRYYEAVKHLDAEQFMKLVNHFLDHAKFAPTPEEFRAAAQTIMNNEKSYFEPEQMEDPRSAEKMQEMLKRYGVRSLLEAVELEAQKRRGEGK